jgi:hypothetical protein
MLSKAIKPYEPPAKHEGVPQLAKVEFNMDAFKPKNAPPDEDEDA